MTDAHFPTDRGSNGDIPHTADPVAGSAAPREREIAGAYGEAFPNSSKVYVEGCHGVRVPMREVSLSGGEPSVRLYDTGLPPGS